MRRGNRSQAFESNPVGRAVYSLSGTCRRGRQPQRVLQPLWRGSLEKRSIEDDWPTHQSSIVFAGATCAFLLWAVLSSPDQTQPSAVQNIPSQSTTQVTGCSKLSSTS